MNKKLTTLIDMAIRREEEAYSFYMDIYGKIEDPSVRDTIEFIAAEEKKHKAFLVNFREKQHGARAMKMSEVTYYKIAEYLKEPEIVKDMQSQDVYLIASHRELRSHKFYTELASLQPEGEAKTMLSRMANEELKHKEKMEYLYANTAFPQTSGG